MKRTASKMIITISLLVFAVSLAIAMGPRGEENLPPSLKETREEGTLTIRKIIEDPSGYVEKQIVLEGTFRGWKGKCESSKPLTRSDWILEDETGCIYVTGKVPPDLSPMAPKGEQILVTGTVQTGPDGAPLIRAETVRNSPSMQAK